MEMWLELGSGTVKLQFAQDSHTSPQQAKQPCPFLLQIWTAIECPQSAMVMVLSGLLNLHTERSLKVQVKTPPLE